MQFSILCSSESWYFRDLCRAAGDRHRLRALSFERLAATLRQGAPPTWSCPLAGSHEDQLLACDAVLVRTMPPGTLEQVVFRMDLLARLATSGCPVVNPPRAIEMAVDKFLASAQLHQAGLAVPETIACQTVDQALSGFHQLGGDVVLKPLFGSEGRGMMRISDENLAWRAFKTLQQLGAVIYLQRFVEHEGADIRVLVLGNDLYSIERRSTADWRTNVSRGAVTAPHDLTEQRHALARRAAEVVGAPLAGVDILPGRDGIDYVLEVNAVPGWKALARTLEVDIAALVLEYLEQRGGSG